MFKAALRLRELLSSSTSATETMETYTLNAAQDLVKTADVIRKAVHSFMLDLHIEYCEQAGLVFGLYRLQALGHPQML